MRWWREGAVRGGGDLTTALCSCCVVAPPRAQNLRTLELERLGVRLLPMVLTCLTQLTRLSFTGEMHRACYIREDISCLTGLQDLDLSANLMSHLPLGLFQLIGLTALRAGMMGHQGKGGGVGEAC